MLDCCWNKKTSDVGFLFLINEKLEQVMERWFGASPAIKQASWTVIVKKELENVWGRELWASQLNTLPL